MNSSIKPIVLSIVVLVVISCGISINNNNIYQDGDWANAQWLGQDVVTLFIAVPMLLLSYFQSIVKQKWKWMMIMGGILFYFVYTYAFFSIVAKLTFLYLFHLPIFGLSIFGLFLTLSYLFHSNYKIEMQDKWIKTGIIFYLLLIAIMLSFLWISDIVSHLTIPDYKSDTPTGEPPLIVYSLDLALVVPLMLAAVFGYIKKRQYGYKMTGIILTKSTIMGFALMGMSLSMYLKHFDPDKFLIVLWCIIGILGSLITIIFLKNIRNA